MFVQEKKQRQKKTINCFRELKTSLIRRGEKVCERGSNITKTAQNFIGELSPQSLENVKFDSR